MSLKTMRERLAAIEAARGCGAAKVELASVSPREWAALARLRHEIREEPPAGVERLRRGEISAAEWERLAAGAEDSGAEDSGP